jgi:hypothetical protein
MVRFRAGIFGQNVWSKKGKGFRVTFRVRIQVLYSISVFRGKNCTIVDIPFFVAIKG